MFTLGIIYFLVYTLVIICLLITTTLALPFNMLTQHSITIFATSIQKYTNFKLTFYLLIFFLTGLPPFGLFFVKFNIFIFLLYQTHFFFIILLFIIFFCNMLFYIQIFNIKNFKKNSYSQFTNLIIKDWHNTYLLTVQTSYSSFNLLFIVNLCVIFISLLIFFYSDLFIVCTL